MIEIVSKRPYESCLRQTLFEACGLTENRKHNLALQGDAGSPSVTRIDPVGQQPRAVEAGWALVACGQERESSRPVADDITGGSPRSTRAAC